MKERRKGFEFPNSSFLYLRSFSTLGCKPILVLWRQLCSMCLPAYFKTLGMTPEEKKEFSSIILSSEKGDLKIQEKYWLKVKFISTIDYTDKFFSVQNSTNIPSHKKYLILVCFIRVFFKGVSLGCFVRVFHQDVF